MKNLLKETLVILFSERDYFVFKTGHETIKLLFGLNSKSNSNILKGQDPAHRESILLLV